ncbi:L-seryl-tRNA(Sec) selenium transferase [Roseibacillus ishigakijimensis]|uniref:L-seryl-tRNA(Sec) selenium transferase n=1 Tax=Roseibacillus ishigakijimensis TaxID=454146 RepID=A0A934VNY5_9BACT|nr:L-seryl-tRNA(Sec) selenium transferase [Roseibacillus ishigakijimensis]MBK1835546.1 L-seryl-tRNA(Sec) selenium transferase [Roseibacillus ishigakijimensis]
MNLAALPSVETLAQRLAADSGLPKSLIIGFIKRQVGRFRERLQQGEKLSRNEIEAEIGQALEEFEGSRLQPVLNGTGILIHTNLGRAPLGTRAAQAVYDVATNYCNLEVDLATGKRGKRGAFLEESLSILVEAEAATVVNNCAAALVLTLRALIAEGRNEVIVSRGELVEIGGGFRIPDILETSGAKLVEVGATNKTHLRDYENALSERTALILKVHRSNFYQEGFIGEADLGELSALSRQQGIPLVEDLGSGALMNTDELAPIEHEPRPQEQLARGIELVLFSGDKLLGGPQAGIIAGRADLVARIKKEPFYRAVRPDKLILTALQEVILDYLTLRDDPSRVGLIPVLDMLRESEEELREKARALQKKLEGESEIVATSGATGGGTMPRSQFPSLAVRTVHKPPCPKLFTRIEDDYHHIDPRTLRAPQPPHTAE